jgi:hypothetical protein
LIDLRLSGGYNLTTERKNMVVKVGLMNIERLSLETQTLHAELLERLCVREAQRNIGNLEGTFTVKTIYGIEYVYFLHYAAGGRRTNISLGRMSPAIESLIAQHREGRRDVASDIIGIRELCAQIKAGRAAVVDPATAKVVRELEAGGIFRVGGILVGTLAFACIGNLLGVIWDRTTLATRDIDLAFERTVSVAVPKVEADVPKSIESLAMGFFPLPRLNPKHPSTSFTIRKSPLRIDLLTPRTGGQGEDPVYIPRLKAAAQPLPYLDYLFEDPVRGALLNGEATLVLIPQPIRFALHKLIVSQEREAAAEAKKYKDLWQAFQLLTFFEQERPQDVEPAWKDLLSRGPNWRRRADAGLAMMQRRFGKSALAEGLQHSAAQG